MKLNKIIATLSVATILGGSAIVSTQMVQPSVTANAAKHHKKHKKAVWKHGMPKALRGKYETKHFGADLMETLDMRAKTFTSWEAGMPPRNNYHLRYKVVGHNKFTILYDTHGGGNFRASKNSKITITKINKNHLKVQYDHHIYRKVKELK